MLTKETALTMSRDDLFNHFGGEMSRGGVSRTIRGLDELGLDRGQIAKLLDKRYQHVRNVLITTKKKS